MEIKGKSYRVIDIGIVSISCLFVLKFLFTSLTVLQEHGPNDIRFVRMLMCNEKRYLDHC